MSLVKWVHRYGFWDSRLAREDPNGVPVIPLDSLTEVVEGLKEINAKSVIAYSIAPELSATACLEINKVTQRLLASLGEVK